MKKSIALFAVVLMIASFTSTVIAQDNTATSSGNIANAQIIKAITLSQGTVLEFGGMKPTENGGTVILGTDGVVTGTPTGAVLMGRSQSAAVFTVTGSGNATYSLLLPQTITVTTESTSSGTDMNMDITDLTVKFSSQTGNSPVNSSSFEATSTLPLAGSETINIGGTLTIGTYAAQASGAYTGTYELTVAYN